MTCREIERLLAGGASERERTAHRAGCAECDRLALDMEQNESLLAGLQAPAWEASFRESLLTIPARTVDCDTAAMLIAASMETASPGEVSPADRSRLEFHLSRCEGCTAAAETLGAIAYLQPPAPAPWVAGRLSASRPKVARPRWKGILDPRAAILVAYLAAIVVMLAGFNPADLARKAGVGLRDETRTAAALAGGSLADRLGSFQQHASRTLAVWRGRAGGYGRAVLTNAMALVMKSDEPRRPPTRPRNGEERGAPPKNETAIQTWRA